MHRYKFLCPVFVRIAAKASETDVGFKLVMTYANEPSSIVEQVMKVTSPSSGS